MMMLKFKLFHSDSVNFLSIVNFLTSYKVMTLEEANSLYRKFKSSEDVELIIPEILRSSFQDELATLNCKFEKTET